MRVFISYSHDSEEHREAVLDLAQRLRAAGLDAVLDRYVVAPPEGWPRWMQAQVEQAKFILAVCTPTYRRRFDGKERRGRGLGANFEGLLSLQTTFEGGSTGRKFVPVLFPGAVAGRSIPLSLRPFTHFRLPTQFDALVELLLGRGGVRPAPIGEVAPELRSEGDLGAPITRERALVELLAMVFTVDELRRWLRLDPACTRIAGKLPGTSASQEDVIDAAVAALTRVGLVDQGFLERLARDFPRRIADIRRVAATWGLSPPTVQAAKKATTRTARAREPSESGAGRSSVTIKDNARVTVGGHLVGGDLIIDGRGTPGRKRRPAGD